VNARELYERVAELERARTPFALATVVARQAPVSSHLGDRAIVLSDGRMQGFVGGSCSRDVVRRQSLEAMRSGDARLVHVEATCASEGAVDVYIEPHLPARTLLIAGFTPVADELGRLASLLDGYRVVRVVDESELPELSDARAARPLPLAELGGFLTAMDAQDRARLVVVVASQGHYDDTALASLLAASRPAYVGLVASRKRAEEVFADAREGGIAPERLALVRNPAGIDIGAKRPGEVAVSILAEIIAAVAMEETPA
jgi:xanthine dehydrogenase accessory factor